MHTEAQIDNLSSILDGIEVTLGAMCVSELDGYVAGLLLCPEMISPSEWLPEVLGFDIEPEFRHRRQAEAATAAIIEYYNRVADCLATNPDAYEIVLELSDENTPFWELWIGGFEQAMKLRWQSWAEYLDGDDQDAVAGFSILAALVQIDNFESDLPEDKQEELEAAAPDLIPGAVVAMNKWLKQQVVFPNDQTSGLPFAANTNLRPAQSIKTGRNEPCPCGSGRKYKKCCLVETPDGF